MKVKKNKAKIIIAAVFLVLVVLISATGCASKPNPGNTGSGENSGQTQGQNTTPGSTQSPTGSQQNSGGQDQNNTTPGRNDSQKTALENIMQLARQGKVSNCQFTAGKAVFEDVEKAWGKPDNDKVEYVYKAKGGYATYSKRGFAFGINKGSQIFEIRSYDGKLKEITLSGVKNALGTPALNRIYNGQNIVGYKAGTEYKLEFVFPQPTQNVPDPKLDHICILYPRGTVNYMADDPGRQW
ncbi:YjgB family protein [Desulfotomaculum copahuensis]|uniref:DUF4309 domain-containing protein n=1 Tax=Desulfotomaculum copahuensis TaxID=1838280 RepID=A0A1B7LAL4_9FIRM|nr:YjgB family protein [Desulfotomaculum copahuensis]OAT79384.1 hypothetical protein A6M21_01190 [Desulfotomaculum copahuensis]